MQKGIRLNDGHVASLGLLARQDGTRKGYLSKRSADNTKWQTKWFALLHNLLFYFESDSSTRPSGLYLLEGCVCDRAPSPKPALSAKEPPEKQVRPRRGWGPSAADRTQTLVPGLSARPPVAQSGQGQRAGGAAALHPPLRWEAGPRGGEGEGSGGLTARRNVNPHPAQNGARHPRCHPSDPESPTVCPDLGGVAPARWRGRQRWMHGAPRPCLPAALPPGSRERGRLRGLCQVRGCSPQGPVGRHRVVMVSQQHTEGSQAPR